MTTTPAPGTLVVVGPEPRQPLGRETIGHQEWPLGTGARVPDIGDQQGADLVPGQQVPPARSAKGDAEISASREIGNAGGEVQSGGPVDGDDRKVEILQSRNQGGDRFARRTLSTGAEQRVHQQAGIGPGPSGPTWRTPAACASAAIFRSSSLPAPGNGATQTGIPDLVQHPRRHPAVATVVADSRRDDYALLQPVTIPGTDRGGDGPPRRFHERGQADARGLGGAIPGGRLFR
jgi:hypothetical protein